eukprot:8157393-Karenia_brevis.AAC.1
MKQQRKRKKTRRRKSQRLGLKGSEENPRKKKQHWRRARAFLPLKTARIPVVLKTVKSLAGKKKGKVQMRRKPRDQK